MGQMPGNVSRWYGMGRRVRTKKATLQSFPLYPNQNHRTDSVHTGITGVDMETVLA